MLAPAANGAMLRVKSPSPGISTFVTSAPSAPRSQVQYGPASMCVRSSTTRPASGPVRGASACAGSAEAGPRSTLFTCELRFALGEERVEPFSKIGAAENFRVPGCSRHNAVARSAKGLDDLLGRLDRQRRVCRKRSCQRIDGCIELLRIDDLVDEPDRLRRGR